MKIYVAFYTIRSPYLSHSPVDIETWIALIFLNSLR